MIESITIPENSVATPNKVRFSEVKEAPLTPSIGDVEARC